MPERSSAYVKKPKRRSKPEIANDPVSKLQAILGVAGVLSVALFFYIASLFESNGKALIPLGVFALFAGMFFEAKRLFKTWTALFWVAIGSFAFSFLAFLPGRRERGYDFEFHFQFWPYAFIFIFLLATAISNRDKTTTRLTEGLSLLQSIAVIYWAIDLHLYEVNVWPVYLVMGVGLLFSLFTLFNAFTPFILSRTSRLTLSIWSCFIMILFALDNIFKTYANDPIEAIGNIPDAFFVALQFFLLGVSSVYMLQNFLLLFEFVPGKNEWVNDEYYIRIRALKTEHISRYSDQQVKFFQAFLCLVITGLTFYVNFRFQILPRSIAIWSVFVIFPFLIYLFELVTAKKSRQEVKARRYPEK